MGSCCGKAEEPSFYEGSSCGKAEEPSFYEGIYLMLLLLLLLLVMLWWIEVRRYWLLLVVLMCWLLVILLLLLLLLGVGIRFWKIPFELDLEWNKIYHFKLMLDDKHIKSQITKKEEQKEIDILFYLLCHVDEMRGLPTPRVHEIRSATFGWEPNALPSFC